MSLFRNVVVFTYADDAEVIDLAALEAAANEHPARAPEPSQGYTIGFAPALFGKAEARVHVAEGGRLAMAAIHIYEKKVPRPVWNEEAERRAEEFQKTTGKYPSKVERETLEGDAYRALLARAFPKQKVVRVLFVQDQRLVLVGSASKDDVDSVTKVLREALGTFKVYPVRNTGETEAALTLWVKNGPPHDRETGTGFFLGEAATMSRASIKGEGPAPVATVKNSDLRRDDVQEHINCGKRVHRLAFACRLSDQFVVYGSVDKDFVLRGFDAQASQETREAIEGGDEAAYYAGLFLLEAKPLASLVGLLRVHLVGDIQQPEGDLFDDGEDEPKDAAAKLDAMAREDGVTGTLESGGKVLMKFGEGPDPLYDDAVAFVRESGKCSIAKIQRQLKTGYNRSARLIERMEEEGIVSRANEKGVRQVLVAEM